MPAFNDPAYLKSRQYRDAVTEAQPIVDYVLSLSPEHRPADDAMPALAYDVAARIARDGAWRIQKEKTGMFAATRPV